MSGHSAKTAVLALPLVYGLLVAWAILFRPGVHPGFALMYLTCPWSLIPIWLLPGAFGPRPRLAGGDTLFMVSALLGAVLNAYILFWFAKLTARLIAVVAMKWRGH